jgi:CHASE2 domain-containing sensor protein
VSTVVPDTIRNCIALSKDWLIARLKRKSVRYWITALIVFLLTITGSSKIYEYLHLTDARSRYFQLLLEYGPMAPRAKFVRLVLVDDDEYWLGYPAGRRPIKRDYLASIVNALVDANAYVIALDFDTRSPNPKSPLIPPDYQSETDTLIKAIENAAQKGKKIVLPTSASKDSEGQWQHDADIYQPYGYCTTGVPINSATKENTRQTDTFEKNITCGYIELPNNPLIVPLSLALADGSSLDSFALAVAKAARLDLVSDVLKRGTGTRYSNYITEEKFKESKFSAGSVLKPGADNSALQASVVIVGGRWKSLALGRGPSIDSHPTPIGSIVGAELNANLVEDLLDNRSYKTPPDWVLSLIEILFSLFAAIAFAVIIGIWGKVFSIFFVFLFLIFVQWLVLHGLGVFFDVFVPLLGLALHTLYERLFSPHEPGSVPSK